jgi:homopolymeric O-antigen transport system permease protein
VSRGSSAVDERTDDRLAPDAAPTSHVGSDSAVRPPEVDATSASRVTTIRPARRWPHLDVRELWHYRELLGTLVWRDIVVRYKQTFLGIAWAILVPVFTSAIYVIVFGKFAQFPAGDTPYPSLVVAGVLPMQYFASALVLSSMSLMANLQLVTKVYFPRALLPLAAVTVPLIDFAIGIPVLVALMYYYGTWPAGAEVLLAPFFIGLAVVTALGSGFLLSAINVRFRDVRYMIPVFLQVLPLLSGVMYAVEEIPTKWQWVLAFNPMTAVISGWRWTVLDASAPNPGQLAVGVAVGVALFVGGLAVFRSAEPGFADTI